MADGPEAPPPSQSPKTKKSNPLDDLISTEKAYVDNLTAIIRKVAGAWSRSNLPPPELDTMFRSIEGVYKANRGLHAKLKDIGANPSSPKALGDLLMSWIHDLEAPYSTYCSKFSSGFDSWSPVQSNPKLANILEAFSAVNPPPGSPDVQFWTLDMLFLLPRTRLKYYRKLYSRLLKSTAPGRSDHRLLAGALETLDRLLETLDSRASVSVSGTSEAPPSLPAVEPEDQVVITADIQPPSSPPLPVPPFPPLQPNEPLSNPASEDGSAPGSVTSGERLSDETANTSIVSRGSNATLSMPISHLERHLSTARTLDIFTMNPKVVKLQIAPPGLTFTRELRTSADVVIRFTSRATNQEVVHYMGHVYILSDLFLICERMEPEDQAHPANDGADLWLCYPPLAGKVLRVSEVEGQPHALEVAIMRKEHLILETDSRQRRDQLISYFKECIEFSASLPPMSKVPPPPVPQLPPLSRDGPFPPPDFRNGPMGPGPNGPHDGGFPRSSSAQPLMNGPPGHGFPPPTRSTSFTGGPPGPQGFPPGGPPPGSLGGPPGPHGFSSGPPSGPPGGPPGPPRGPPGPHGFASGPPPPGPPGGPPGPGFPPGGPPQFGASPGPSGRPGMGGPLPPPNMRGGPPMHMQGQPPHGQPPFNMRPGPGGPPQGPVFPPQGPQGQGFPPGPGRPPQGGPGMAGYPPGMGPGGPSGGPMGFGGPPGMGPGGPPSRPPSEPMMNGVHKATSVRSLNSQYSGQDHRGGADGPLPPMPPFYANGMQRNSSQPNLHAPQPRPPLLPSAQSASRAGSVMEPSFDEPSPPGSPVPEMKKDLGPVTTTISAQMKCKVFLKQQHAQWKSLGSAKLKLYRQDPTNIKQLVVEADNKGKDILISTIVLTDGVERVGKTGVAIELSNNGARTGVVYMIQLRNEESAAGLFDSLLSGSDRALVR